MNGEREKFKSEKPRKLDIVERIKRFGEFGAEMEKFVNPSEAELKDIVKSEYYPIRRIDVERLLAIAEFSKEDRQNIEEELRILDLGGGKGLLAKSLADVLAEKQEKGMVVDLDKNEKILEAASKFYSKTPGLHFVISDSEKEAAGIFNTRFNLVIVSWAHIRERGGPEYSETIKKLKPPFFVNIGEEGQEVTAGFDPGDEYIKIGEWSGPLSHEIFIGHPFHLDLAGEEGYLEKYGSNLFEIYARKDITEEQLAWLKKELKDTTTAQSFKWEPELRELFPAVSEVNTDSASFRRNDEIGESS